ATVSGIEGRTVFEVELLGALSPQPVESSERHGDRLVGRVAARLERHDDAVSGGYFQPRTRHAQQLHGAHVGPDQRVGEIGRSGEVVGDAAKQDAHGAAPREMNSNTRTFSLTCCRIWA